MEEVGIIMMLQYGLHRVVHALGVALFGGIAYVLTSMPCYGDLMANGDIAATLDCLSTFIPSVGEVPGSISRKGLGLVRRLSRLQGR